MPDSAILISTKKYDWTPWAQKASSTPLDTAVMALSPWAYWKMNEASGNPQDSSGNGRHATAELTPYYQYPQITSKGGPSIYLGNARIKLPSPYAHLIGQSWTLIGLYKFLYVPANGSPVGNPDAGSVFLSQSSAAESSAQDFKLGYTTSYGTNNLVQNTYGVYSSGCDGQMGMNKPLVVAFCGNDIPWIVWAWDLWVNGLKVNSGMAQSTTASGTSYLYVGRPLNNTITMAEFLVSNLAMFNRTLTDEETLALTQAYMDKAAYQTAWTAR